jgi:hypothetical protein
MITVCMTVNVVGNAMPPAFVFEGKDSKTQYFLMHLLEA